ncbi:hypothetical protein M885DRAFT_534378 [Pelagophyceae sp. CCMP2097]|nr:hypothetical protein M885DRAFT_534378 [Pelagophyceae sp. CCMP2097]|mmetsp:Transcript_12367/g.43723  ORF Transcript_12367/g.43723 Transcript_12367/m.43723 type:complete len:441 (-) Transcript_12367:718-2040(-)
MDDMWRETEEEEDDDEFFDAQTVTPEANVIPEVTDEKPPPRRRGRGDAPAAPDVEEEPEPPPQPRPRRRATQAGEGEEGELARQRRALVEEREARMRDVENQFERDAAALEAVEVLRAAAARAAAGAVALPASVAARRSVAVGIDATAAMLLSDAMCVCGSPSKHVCAKCQAQRYCSRECQVGDWRAHQRECKRAAQERALALVPVARERCGSCSEALPLGDAMHAYYACCGKSLCEGCTRATVAKLAGICPMCAAALPRSDVEYLRLLQRRCDDGDAEAQHRLGMKHQRGDCGLRPNAKRAAELYALAAQQGFAKAQCDLAHMYQSADGVKLDLGRAAAHFAAAAHQGDSVGQQHLAAMLYQGTGVRKDAKRAVHYWRLAAAQGDPKAQAFLGACYFKGEGVERDLHEALRLVRLATAAGVTGAQKHVERLEAILSRSR